VTICQDFLYFLAFDTVLFPNLLLDEILNDEFVQPQFSAILKLTYQENNRSQGHKLSPLIELRTGPSIKLRTGSDETHRV